MTQTPILTVLVFAVFMIVTPILLLNMLIATMANTYVKVIEKSERDWIHQWAKIVIVLERTFIAEQLLEFQKLYSVKIDNPAEIEREYYRGEINPNSFFPSHG